MRKGSARDESSFPDRRRPAAVDRPRLRRARRRRAAGPPVKVIFDTDMAGDVDDVGALAVLHAMADLGEAEILAVGISSRNEDVGPVVDAINTWYGRPDIPIGYQRGIQVGYPADTGETITSKYAEPSWS